MPRSRGDKEYILPTKGLNTETNLLHFPQEFASDALNVELDYNPQCLRPRKGMRTSLLPRLAETRNASSHEVAISSHLWESANNDPDTNLVIVQVGRYLYFFDDDALNDPTTSIVNGRIDLNNSLSGTSKGTLALLEPTRVNFATIKGKVMATSEQINPTLLQYDGTEVSASAITIQIRDILGIEDGLKVDEHPATLSDEHHYNLLNQGWYKQRRLTSGSKTESDPITEYETQWSNEYPSNADIVWAGMVDSSGDLIFDAEWLRDQTFGSTPAPRGHYVVDAFAIDRASILADPLDSGSTSGGSSPGGGGGLVDRWDEYNDGILP